MSHTLSSPETKTVQVASTAEKAVDTLRRHEVLIRGADGDELTARVTWYSGFLEKGEFQMVEVHDATLSGKQLAAMVVDGKLAITSDGIWAALKAAKQIGD